MISVKVENHKAEIHVSGTVKEVFSDGMVLVIEGLKAMRITDEELYDAAKQYLRVSIISEDLDRLTNPTEVSEGQFMRFQAPSFGGSFEQKSEEEED